MGAVQAWKLASGVLYFTAAAYSLAAVVYWLEVLTKGMLSKRFAIVLTVLGLAGNTAAIILRLFNFAAGGTSIDRFKLVNVPELLLMFAWFTVCMNLLLAWKHKFKFCGIFVMPIVVALLAYDLAVVEPSSGDLSTLVIYRNDWLVSYVLTSALSYSAFAVSFGLGVMYLLKDYLNSTNARGYLAQQLPNLEILDDAGYRLVSQGFPFFSASIIIGAVWAYSAWGRFWSWEPKETWSFISWLAYVAYLHARFLYGWRGNRSAWMAVMGFLAVLFTFVGVNYFLPGQNILQNITMLGF